MLRVALIPAGELPTHCGICGRRLGVPEDPRSEDCGGDCLQCMADCDDPDCVDAIRAIEARERENDDGGLDA